MEVRGRAGTLCMSQYEREQFLMTTELESLAIADESQNGDMIDQLPQILQNELRNSNKQLQGQQSSKLINSGTPDSSQQSNQN